MSHRGASLWIIKFPLITDAAIVLGIVFGFAAQSSRRICSPANYVRTEDIELFDYVPNVGVRAVSLER